MSGFPYLDSQNVMDFLIPKTVEPTKLNWPDGKEAANDTFSISCIRANILEKYPRAEPMNRSS
jgi:hypothetical protein